jgi:hypothetical protein
MDDKKFSKGAIGTAPHILWQNILDTQENVSYTASNEKEVLINYQSIINWKEMSGQ